MTDPLPLAFFVALSLMALVAVVTVMLWRTVHGHHRSSHEGGEGLRLAEEYLGSRLPRSRPHPAPSIDELRQRAQRLRQDNEQDELARVAAALKALGDQDPRLSDEAASFRPEIKPHQWRKLPEELLLQKVLSDRQDPLLDAVFATIAPLAASQWARPASEFGLTPDKLIKTSDEDLEIVRILHGATSTLGLLPPRIYLDEGREHAVIYACTSVQDRWSPSLVLGKQATQLGPASTLAFECGAKIAYLLPSLSLLAAGADEEKLIALVGSVEDQLGLAREDPGEKTTRAVKLPPMPPRAKELLTELLSGNRLATDALAISRWVDAAHESAWRMGLLFSGSLIEAVDYLSSPDGLLAHERQPIVERLVAFWLSEDYLELRRKLVEGTKSQKGS